MTVIIPTEAAIANQVAIEQLALDYDVSFRENIVGGWMLVGSSTNVNELLERLNDEKLLVVFGTPRRIEAP